MLQPDRTEQIRQLAYDLWTLRGRPEGSPEYDWYAAERQVENRETLLRDFEAGGLSLEPAES